MRFGEDGDRELEEAESTEKISYTEARRARSCKKMVTSLTGRAAQRATRH